MPDGSDDPPRFSNSYVGPSGAVAARRREPDLGVHNLIWWSVLWELPELKARRPAVSLNRRRPLDWRACPLISTTLN